MKKFLSIIIAIVMLVSIITVFSACGKEEAKLPTPSTTSQTIITEENSENNTTEETTTTNIDDFEFNFHVLDFDESYKEFWELSGSSVSSTIISFPSTKQVENQVLEQFYTADEFNTYLNEYSDIATFKTEELRVEEDHFVFKYPSTTIDKKTGKAFYFFLSDPRLSKINELNVEMVTVDKEGKAVYIILEESTPYSIHNMFSYFEDKIETEAKSTYGLCNIGINDRYCNEVLKEKNIRDIYFVLPSFETNS